jgi:hypothetical protein
MQLLGHEMEALVVEAKHLGIPLDEMLASFASHWQRLSNSDSHKPAPNSGEGARKKI